MGATVFAGRHGPRAADREVISQRPEKYASVMDTALLRQMFRTMIHRVDVRIERYMVKLEKLQEMSGVPQGPRGPPERSSSATRERL